MKTPHILPAIQIFWWLWWSLIYLDDLAITVFINSEIEITGFRPKKQ